MIGNQTPWLISQDDVDRALAGVADSAAPQVLVTLRGNGKGVGAEEEHALPIGVALSAALAGPTHSMTMLVGYFSDGAGFEPAGDASPIGLICREAAEELGRPWFSVFDQASVGEPDHPGSLEWNDKSGFRLLFGAFGGRARASRLAMESYWWLCRWRQLAPAAAEAWFDSVIQGARDARQHAYEVKSGPQARDFRELAAWLWQAGGTPVERLSPLPIIWDEAASADLETRISDGREAEAFKKWRDTWRCGHEYLAIASQLASFFTLRGAHIKVQPVPAKGEDGIFHGKLYLIERGGGSSGDAEFDTPRDTVAVMGSANWSSAALFGTGLRRNTELSSLVRARSWPWQRPISADGSYGERLVWTGRELFFDQGEATLLAHWASAVESLPSWSDMYALMELAQRRGQAASQTTTQFACCFVQPKWANTQTRDSCSRVIQARCPHKPSSAPRGHRQFRGWTSNDRSCGYKSPIC